MHPQTIQPTPKTDVKTIAITAAASVVATLGLLVTTVKPSLAETYVPGHYALYGQWIPGHFNAGPVPHYLTPNGMFYVGHYGAGGRWIPGHYQ